MSQQPITQIYTNLAKGSVEEVGAIQYNTILLIHSIPLDTQTGLGGSQGSTVLHQLPSFQLKLIVFHPIVVYILLSMTEVLVSLAMHGTAAVMKLLVCYFLPHSKV